MKSFFTFSASFCDLFYVFTQVLSYLPCPKTTQNPPIFINTLIGDPNYSSKFKFLKYPDFKINKTYTTQKIIETFIEFLLIDKAFQIDEEATTNKANSHNALNSQFMCCHNMTNLNWPFVAFFRFRIDHLLLPWWITYRWWILWIYWRI